MARRLEVEGRIRIRDEGSRNVGRLRRSFGRLTDFLAQRFVITLGDVTRVARTLTGAFTDSIEKANDQEDAVRKLDAALAPLGDRAGAVSEQLQRQASALQQVTRFGDETIISGQALIASFTKNTEEINAATEAALNLATATGRDVRRAFELLGRAATGETATLSRYGVILDDNIPRSERFAAAVEVINQQFGGQAQAQAETFRGLIAQIGNAFGDLQEQVGFAITRNEGLLEQLRNLRDILSSDQTVQLVSNLAGAMVSVAEASARGAQGVAEFAAGLREANARVRQARSENELLDEVLGGVGDKLSQVGAALRSEFTIAGQLLSLVEQIRALGRASQEAADESLRFRTIGETLAEVFGTTSAAAQRAVRFEEFLGENRRILSASTETLTAAELRRRRNLQSILPVFGDLVSASRELFDATERNVRILGEEEQALDDLKDAVNAAGLSFTDFSAELDTLEDALSRIREAERAGVITQREANDLRDQARRRIAELRGETEQSAVAFGQQANALDAAAQGLGRLRDSADPARQNLRSLGEEAERARGSFASLNSEVARSNDLLSVTNRFEGGTQTAQQLPGGGLRVTTVRRSGGGISQEEQP